jgi:hypothetical protein
MLEGVKCGTWYLFGFLALFASSANAHESPCFSSADAVRREHPDAWPSWTVRARGHEGTKCWYASARANARDLRGADKKRGPSEFSDLPSETKNDLNARSPSQQTRSPLSTGSSVTGELSPRASVADAVRGENAVTENLTVAPGSFASRFDPVRTAGWTDDEPPLTTAYSDEAGSTLRRDAFPLTRPAITAAPPLPHEPVLPSRGMLTMFLGVLVISSIAAGLLLRLPTLLSTLASERLRDLAIKTAQKCLSACSRTNPPPSSRAADRRAARPRRAA